MNKKSEDLHLKVIQLITIKEAKPFHFQKANLDMQIKAEQKQQMKKGN